MDTPFLIMVRAPDPAEAIALAEALSLSLGARGFGTRVDGVSRHAGTPRVDLTTGMGPTRDLLVAVRPNEPTWLPAQALPGTVVEAESVALAFLERWGFTSRVATPPAP